MSADRKRDCGRGLRAASDRGRLTPPLAVSKSTLSCCLSMSTYNPFKNVNRPLPPPQRKDISSAETTANKSTTQHRTTKAAGEEEQHTNKPTDPKQTFNPRSNSSYTLLMQQQQKQLLFYNFLFFKLKKNLRHKQSKPHNTNTILL